MQGPGVLGISQGHFTHGIRFRGLGAIASPPSPFLLASQVGPEWPSLKLGRRRGSTEVGTTRGCWSDRGEVTQLAPGDSLDPVQLRVQPGGRDSTHWASPGCSGDHFPPHIGGTSPWTPSPCPSLSIQARLTGSLVFDEEQLEPLFEGVLIDIELHLDPEKGEEAGAWRQKV